MNLQARLDAFAKLGDFLANDFHVLHADKISYAHQKNIWFTCENIKSVINEWSSQLSKDMLSAWIRPYKLSEQVDFKNVLIIMAGNIPLVGFHDFLSVLVTGHNVVVKMSHNDNILLRVIIDKLFDINPKFRGMIKFVDDLKNKQFDAVFSAGSDNSARYIDYYFKNSQRIIRNNRRSIAILDGTETELELELLGADVFSYFGLGCRNVSKLFLPKGYDLNKLFNGFYSYKNIIEHKKYANNYVYNKSVFLIGRHQLIENGFILLKEESSLLSPVAMLYYEFYEEISEVDRFVYKNKEKIQCVISKKDTAFGNSQKPHLWDYADGIDTINFLKDI